MSKSKVRNLFKKFGKSTTDLSEWGKGDDKILKAVENGDITKVESILQKKTINPTKLGIHGFSIFHVASRYGHLPIVEKLLDYGADVNCQTIQGSTALQLACGSGRHTVVDRLIKSGAELHQKDGQSLTALHYACIGCYHECVKILLSNGADVSVVDQNGKTPLYFAASSGTVTICKDLLDKGANINCVDNNQMTPLMGAANQGRKEVCEMLLKKGANRDLTDIEGVTALMHALTEKHEEIQEVFDKAPTIASWDIPDVERKKQVVKGAEGGTRQDTSEMPEADQVNGVAKFVADNSPSPRQQRKDDNIQQSSVKTSSPVQSAAVQKALQAHKADVPKKELEEENDQLNDELHKFRIENFNLQDSLGSHQKQLKEKSKLIQEYEQQINELKEQLETESQKVERYHNMLSLSNTLTESTDDGIETDHWNDSEEDLFGSLKRGKKTGKGEEADDKQLIALLRSQILTYQSENEQLKQKQLQSEDGKEMSTTSTDQELPQKMDMLSQQMSILQQQRDQLKEQLAMYRMNNTPDQYEACSSILEELLSSKHEDIVEPFCNIEVDGQVTGITTIGENLKSGKYSSFDNFEADMKQIFKIISQTGDQELMEKGQELEKIFEDISSSINLAKKRQVQNGDISLQIRKDTSIPVVAESGATESVSENNIFNDNSYVHQLRTDYEKLREENVLLHQDLETLRTTYEKLVQAGDNLQDMYDQLLSEKAEQIMKIDKAAREMEKIVKENEFLLSEGNAMHDDLEKLAQELEDIQDKFKIVEGEKDDLERKLAAVNIPAKASEMSKIIEERDKLKNKCHELQAENETLKHDHEIVLEEVQSMQEQCNQLQGDNEQMTQDFETAQEEFDQLTQQHEGLQQDYNQLEQDYSELLADKEKLETEFLEVQTASVKEHNPLAEEETEELKQENEMLTYEKDQLEMTIKELSKNNALLEEKLDRNKGELGKTLEKLKKEASLRVKLDIGANTDKEKQIKSLQVQVNRLQQQLAETDRRHMDIVNTYRTHLISAVQGHMDEDVQQALHNIIELRSMEEYC